MHVEHLGENIAGYMSSLIYSACKSGRNETYKDDLEMTLFLHNPITPSHPQTPNQEQPSPLPSQQSSPKHP